MNYIVKCKNTSNEELVVAETDDRDAARIRAAEEILKICDSEEALKSVSFCIEAHDDECAEAPSCVEPIFTGGIVLKDHFSWLAWAAVNNAVPYAVDALGRWFELFGPVLRWNEAYDIDGIHGLKPFFSSEACDWVFEGYELCEL